MSLEMNKVAGAVLVGGMITLVSGILADMLVKPETVHVAMAVPEAPTEEHAAAPEAPKIEPVLAMLASADAAAGPALAKQRCGTCHTFEKGGANKVGPNLWGVVGGPHAHVEGFKYSPGMMALHDKPWTYDDLNHFLAGPKSYLPGTKMTFPGLKKVEERATVIAYLRTQADTPVPLPTQAEIDAAAAAAAAAASVQTAAAEAHTDATEQPAEAPAADQPAGEQVAASGAVPPAADGGAGDIGARLASADSAAGEKVAKRCATCHTFTEGGANKVGPNLWGIVGAAHAHKEDFKYSPAMTALHDQAWTYEALDAYLASPKDAIPGNKMAFAGLKKPEDRANLIAYLRSLSATPAPLPEPAGDTSGAAETVPASATAATEPAAAEAPAVEQPAVEPPAAEAEQPAAEQPAPAEQAATAETEQPAAEAPAAEVAAAAPEQPAPEAPAAATEQTASAEAEQPTAETPAPASEQTASAAAEQPAETPAEGTGVAALLAAADPAVGEKVAKRCATCHTFTADGANKVGPNLWNIVGAPHAHKEDFKYSEAMVALHDQPWTYEALDAYLASPKDAIPGNKMAFAGLKKPEDRAALIAYLRTLSESPQPLP